MWPTVTSDLIIPPRFLDVYVTGEIHLDLLSYFLIRDHIRT